MQVSVIIPVYRRKAMLLEAMASVVEQVHRPVELLVVDDGSGDDCAPSAEAFAQAHQDAQLSIRVIKQANQGAPVARDYGARSASGEALLFLDSDDRLTRDGLKALVNAMVETGADCVTGKVVPTDGSWQPNGMAVIGTPYDGSAVELAGYHWHTMGALYRTELYHACGGWHAEIRGSDDWLFQAQVKLTAKRIHFTETTIGYFRHHEGERVGSLAFREPYVRDVGRCCLEMYQLAESKHRSDPLLANRLLKRVFVHALEAGAHGARPLRQALLKSATNFHQADPKLKGFLRCWQAMPAVMDVAAYKCYQRRQTVT